MVLTVVLTALAGISLAITVWQFLAGLKFPLHRRSAEAGFAPAVSLLKPLKGSDAETEACLESWFTQDYAGRIQLLLGVASPDDPVCAVVQRLIAAHPKVDAQLIICGESLGANAKVSTLIQLDRQAQHGIVIISDADVRVPADFIANVVTPLRDEKVGLVNPFYTLANPRTLAMKWEAVAINADFWTSVLQSQTLEPLDFALGAVMAVRREALVKIGGFAALSDYLADDYQLGHRVVAAGLKIALCPVVVECWESPRTWADVWRHQLRWSRTIRVCKPAPYFLSVLGNATLWPLLMVAFNPLSGFLFVAIICWVIRMLTAMHHQSRITRARRHLFYDWLVLLKDLLQVMIWALAFLGNTVTWRGVTYRVGRGGKLQQTAG